MGWAAVVFEFGRRSPAPSWNTARIQEKTARNVIRVSIKISGGKVKLEIS